MERVLESPDDAQSKTHPKSKRGGGQIGGADGGAAGGAAGGADGGAAGGAARRGDGRAKSTGSGLVRIVVVGGGASGVELALAMQSRLHAALRASGADTSLGHVSLLTRGEMILGQHSSGARSCVGRMLAQRKIHVRTRCEGVHLSLRQKNKMTHCTHPSHMSRPILPIYHRGM